VFQNAVDLSYSNFQRRVTFSGSRFAEREKNAIFYGMQTAGDALFSNVVFDGPVDFRTLSVGRILSFRKTHFKSSKTASFQGLTTGGTLQLSEAVFEGNVNLGNCRSTGNFSALGTHFKGAVSLDNTVIEGSAQFRKARFEKGALFTRLETQEEINFQDVKFSGAVSFRGIQIGGPADLTGATFKKHVDFQSARIEESLTATGVSFQDASTFDRLNVSGDARFYRSEFGGPASFVRTDIGGNLGVRNTRFRDAAIFNSLLVGGLASLDNAVFDGQVNFGSAEITGQLQADSTRFTSDQNARFFRMKVGDAAYFKGAIFSGPADFHNATTGSNLDFSGTHFAAGGNFKGTKIGGVMSLEETNFGGALTFTEGSAASLLLSGKSPSPTLSSIDVSLAKVGKALSITNLQIDTLRANSLSVSGQAVLDTVTHLTNLENAAFGSLVLLRLPWATHQEDLRLQGMTYRRIQANTSQSVTEWRKLLYWINHSSFSPQPYSQLEDCFNNERDNGRANEVLVTRKRRETHELRYSLSWFWNQLLDLTVLYGRAPQRILVLAIVVILMGAVVFRDQTIEPRSKDDAGNFFRSLWYSVDVFFPGFLDLKMESVWQPKDHQGFRNHYARFQKIIGWLLIIITMSVIGGMTK